MITAFIQARDGLNRLPGKVIEPLAGVPMVVRVAERVKACKLVDRVVVITTQDRENWPIITTCIKHGIVVAGFNCPPQDVLSRFVMAQELCGSGGGDDILRITADCPLIDPDVLEQLIVGYRALEGEYRIAGIHTGSTSKTGKLGEGRFPDGMDAEIFSAELLRHTAETSDYTRTRYHDEHVTALMWEMRFAWGVDTAIYRHWPDLGHLRWTVDTEDDYRYISEIYGHFYDYRLPKPTMDQVLEFLAAHPSLQNPATLVEDRR